MKTWLTLFACLICTTMPLILFFFSDESCLPHKRKMEKMLRTIKNYQSKIEASDIEFIYKGKTFNVGVTWHGDSFYYGYYTVYINGNHVMTWHVLHHTFSKSRLGQHHGNMRATEEDEIIQEAYKCAKKRNDEYWDKKLATTSYFN